MFIYFVECTHVHPAQNKIGVYYVTFLVVATVDVAVIVMIIFVLMGCPDV